MFPTTYKLQSNDYGNKQKADGRSGTKFLLEKTISDLGYTQSYNEFNNVLQGAYLTGLKYVCHEHYPEPDDLELVQPEQDRSVPSNFQCAIDKFLIHTLKKAEAPGLSVCQHHS